MTTSTSSPLADPPSSTAARKVIPGSHATNNANKSTDSGTMKGPKWPRIPKTIKWDELEDWRKDNEYILSGYRRYAFCISYNILIHYNYTFSLLECKTAGWAV